MKKNVSLFTIIFFITIGFAAVNTVLDIKENINISENLDDFKIEITNLIINNVDKKNLIAKDKESFTFIGSGSDAIKYTVTNYSYQYDAKINLVCTPDDNITVNQINNLEAQSKKSETITSTSTNEITCTLNVEKVSRTEYAEDMCEYQVGTTWNFNYTGGEQEFTVPCDGEYKIELWGAQGGYVSNAGNGAYTSGILALNKNIKFFVYVGSIGRVGSTSGNGGGYNGGGNAQIYIPSATNKYGGGGATDIRLIGGIWNNFESLKSRIMVSAGGGGESSGNGYTELPNMSSGGLIGYSGGAYSGGGGATQTSGGANYPGSYGTSEKGAFGQGGRGNSHAGGGGSGYYGGGGGARDRVDGNGGGGSSFISGHNGCDAIAESSTQTNIIHTGQPNHYSGYIFKETVMVDGAGYNWTNVKESYTGMPSHDGTSTITGNSGNGYAKITYLGI